MSAKVLRADDLGGCELARGLVAEGVAVDDEAHAPEALRGEQPIEHGDGELGLAGAGRHGEQHVPATLRQVVLDRLDGQSLDRDEAETRNRRPRLQIGAGAVDVDLQHSLQAVRRRPVDERAAVIGWACAHRGTRCRSRFRSASGRAGHWQKRRTGRETVHPSVRPRTADGLGSALEAKRPRRSARPDRYGPRRSCSGAWPRRRRCNAFRRTAHSRPGRSSSAIRRSPDCALSPVVTPARSESLGIDFPAPRAQLLVDQGAGRGLVDVDLGGSRFRLGHNCGRRLSAGACAAAA